MAASRRRRARAAPRNTCPAIGGDVQTLNIADAMGAALRDPEQNVAGDAKGRYQPPSYSETFARQRP